MNWLSYHFRPLEAPDVFLARALRPFLAEHVWPHSGTRAFFLRYADEQGPHLRLRFKGDEAWLADHLVPAFDGWFRDRGSHETTPYAPEPERFGGPEALALAEEHFHISTRVVLDRLNRPYAYGDAMFDALRLDMIAAIAADFDRDRAAWYFQQLYAQWLRLFFRPEGAETEANDEFYAVITAQFERSFSLQEESLRHALSQFWTAVSRGQMDKSQAEWTRWLRGNELVFKELGPNLEKALPSLLHLNHNRLGLNNQDEVFVCYILSTVL